jgi:hypothetical protein
VKRFSDIQKQHWRPDSQAMRVKSIQVNIDEKSLASDKIIIDRIEAAAPEITHEKIRGTDNFQKNHSPETRLIPDQPEKPCLWISNLVSSTLRT